MKKIKANYISKDNVQYQMNGMEHATILHALKDTIKFYKNDGIIQQSAIDDIKDIVEEIENPNFDDFKVVQHKNK